MNGLKYLSQYLWLMIFYFSFFQLLFMKFLLIDI
ncbi:hypothetical protein [Christiangramia forsetii]